MADQNKDNQLSNPQKYFICNEICFWFIQVLAIALALTILGLIAISYQQTQSVLSSAEFNHSKQTIRFWQQGYIIDIKVENTNNCPEGYDTFVNYNWPGNKDGCYCSSDANNFSFDFVLVGKCSSNLISMGCQTVNAQKSYTLNMWKGGKLLCYKRAKSMNFYNSILSVAPIGGTSPNMVPCAINQSHQVFTLPGVSCPVTALSNASIGLSQTTLDLDDKYNYLLNFDVETGYPISDIKLTEYQFCSYFNQTNISPNKQGTYTLELQYISQPCSLTDPRMVTVDTLNEYDFYTNNTRVFQMISTLPAYPNPSVDYKYYLGYVPYPAWTYQCRLSSTYNLKAATRSLLFQQSSQALVICASVVLPCVIVLAFLFRLFYIIRHIIDLKSRSSYKSLMLTEDEIAEQIPNLNIKKSSKRQGFYFILELIIILAIAGIIIYSIYTLTNNSIWIKSIIKFQCTEQYLYNIFLYYESVIDSTSQILVKSIFVVMVLLIAHIVQFVLRFYIGDLYTKKEAIVQQSVASNQMEAADILNKEGNLQGINNMQESSEIIINKENSELKVYDMDYLMGQGGQTKDNFYNGLQREASMNVVKKKKKKQVRKNRRNFLKDDQK